MHNVILLLERSPCKGLERFSHAELKRLLLSADFALIERVYTADIQEAMNDIHHIWKSAFNRKPTDAQLEKFQPHQELLRLQNEVTIFYLKKAAAEYMSRIKQALATFSTDGLV